METEIKRSFFGIIKLIPDIKIIKEVILTPIIPEANTDGSISMFLLCLKFIVKRANPKADPIAAKLPLKLASPKSFQTIIKTPQRASAIDTIVETDIISRKI